jgi:hypothetical protein
LTLLLTLAKMEHRYKLLLSLIIVTLFSSKGHAQSLVKGTVFQAGSIIKIAHVQVYNKNTRNTVYSNNLADFTIPASLKDTLEFSSEGYIKDIFIVNKFTDVLIQLQQINVLPEVEIKGKLRKHSMGDIAAEYSKEKGIFYKGRPPLALLSPFGGSPVTFFYELFSKDAKRVRRLNKLAEKENEYEEVERRFTNKFIKDVVPIKDEEIEDFKVAYWPKLEQLRIWSDYDLYNYIKRSYELFLKNR